MYLFIINPQSGNGKGLKVWLEIGPILNEYEIQYCVQFTKQPRHATEIARTAGMQNNVKAVIVIGGDGTMNEVGNGLVGTKVPMGYLPAGSGNDFARSLQIPTKRGQLKLAVDRILKHQIHKIDTAKLITNTGERFLIGSAGIGFDATVTKIVNQSNYKKWLGQFSYLIGAIKTFSQYKAIPFHLQIDEQSYDLQRVWFAAILNSSYYGGGMKICPQAVYNDGFLDICCIHNLCMTEFIRMLPSVYKGAHIGHPSVNVYRGRHIVIEAKDSLAVHTDGEVIGTTDKLEIKVQPETLFVL